MVTALDLVSISECGLFLKWLKKLFILAMLLQVVAELLFLFAELY